MAVDVERVEDAFFIPITKTVSNDDGTVTVLGKPTTETVDFDDQIVDKDFMKSALPQWLNSWGNIRLQHGPKPVGRGQRLEWDENDDPWLTAKIVDPDAVRLVKEGVLQGFSVGIHRPRIKPDRKARGGRIADGREVHEISLVDRPANPDCRISVVKAAGGGRWEVGKAVDPDEGRSDRAPGGVPDIAGDGHLVPDSARAGNIHRPTDSNSGDFDSMGNPILQPGHVRSNAAEVTVVAMDDRGVTLRVGQHEYVVPYTVESDGSVHFQTGDMVRLPFDPKALPDDPRERLHAPGDSGKGAETMGAAVATMPPQDKEKAVWSTAKVNDLPDDAFAYISPGGKKVDGKTEPRDLRHLPYRDGDGKPDAAHVRNALARLDQTDIPEEAKAEARRKLEAAAKEVGIEVGEPARVADIRKAAEERHRTHGFCVKCRKSVKLGEKMSEEHGTGGIHAVYKGECGHAVRRFDPRESSPESQEAAAKGADTSPPSGMGAEAGSVTGDAVGHRPPNTDPDERQENDIISRLRQALKEYEEAQRAEAEGTGTEGAEDRALAKIKELTNAGIAVQQQEATEDGSPVDLEAAVKAAVAKALEEAIPGIRKAAHSEHKKRLREAHRHLGSLIDELGEDPIEEHERGVPEGGHSDGAASADGDKSHKGVDPNPDATNPQRNISAAANSDRLAPVRSGEWLERVREGIREVEELARIVAGASRPLEAGGKDRGGMLQEGGKPVPRIRRPGSQEWDFTAGDGGSAPHRRGEDADEMHKAAGATPRAIQAAIAEGIRIGSEQATKAAAAVMAPVVRRLEQVEHMARPANGPVTPVDRNTDFADPRAARDTDEHLRGALQGLPPRERNAATVDLISALRKRQGAPR